MPFNESFMGGGGGRGGPVHRHFLSGGLVNCFWGGGVLFWEAFFLGGGQI